MKCVAVGCQTGRKSGLRIHSFPRDPKRRLEWAVKVNIAENGKLWVPPKDNRYGVCEVHFEEDQYEPKRTDRKLKPFAVPTLFSHRKVPKQRRRLVRSGPTSSSTNVTTAVDTVAKVDTVVSTATSVATVSTVMTPVVSSSVAKRQPAHLRPVLPSVSCLPNTGPIILVPVSKPSGVPLPNKGTSPSTQMPVILSVESLAPSDLTPILPRPSSYEKLKEETTALCQQADELRRKVADLSCQKVRVMAALARQTELLSRFLRMDQVEWLQKLPNDQPIKWTEPTLQLALDIYRCSPEAYRKLLVSHFPFPMETALRTYCKEKGICGGVPAELLQTVTLPQADGEEEDENVNIIWL
ncbi:PH domain-containing protein DDB_G0287875 isoform X2 [Dermacentor silvarum]|nr:PH domain-containing protein DDB_G0287875 isoform X2 [Dermacentor silvarum]